MSAASTFYILPKSFIMPLFVNSFLFQRLLEFFIAPVGHLAIVPCNSRLVWRKWRERAGSKTFKIEASFDPQFYFSPE
jgi:hypothetical protein